ncbi:hypothetical protein QQ045_033533 [Rhodiola kirilowii]
MCKTRADLAPVLLTLFLILILGLAHLSICDGVSAKGLDSLKSADLGAMLGSTACGKSGSNCIGLVGEKEEDGDAEMDSETNRRILMMQPRRYVSYDTLRKDLVPCERPGASYYNCRSGGVANPYTRGCEVITGCARNIRDIQT